MKKIFSLIIIAATVFSLSSCKEKNREYSEEEVKDAAQTLIMKSAPLNDIFWGKGIDYIRDANYSVGYYFPANNFQLAELGFFTIDGLKEKTAAVFSKSYCDSIFSTVLSPITDEENTFLGLTRYYQKYSDLKNTSPECIMVNSNAVILLRDEVEYLYDTLTVTGSKGERVYADISVKVTRNGVSQIRELSIGFLEEENGWRIDTPTYMSFMEYEE